jgi:hypothetical protein
MWLEKIWVKQINLKMVFSSISFLIVIKKKLLQSDLCKLEFTKCVSMKSFEAFQAFIVRQKPSMNGFTFHFIEIFFSVIDIFIESKNDVTSCAVNMPKENKKT